MRYVSNHSSAPEFIGMLKEFDGNSMWARKGKINYYSRLYMPINWQTIYDTTENIIYTVVSFNTPIAWLTNDGIWYFPSVSYSGYSSRHQSLTFRGILIYFQNLDLSGFNEPHRLRRADRYSTVDEMREYWNDGRILPINRTHSYVSPRGIKNGDYIRFGIDETVRYRRVYNINKVRINGRYAYYAETVIKGVTYKTYIGTMEDRIDRLRD